jgi:cyanophycinase-like exopeptidase
MSAFIYLLAGNPRARGVKPDPAMQSFFSEVGRSAPAVAYIGAASGDDRSFFEAMRTAMQASGAGEVELVPLCAGPRSAAEAQHVLMRADAIFISGGDVADGMSVLRAGEGVIATLRERFEAGIPFMGLSAGSIMLTRGWVRWAEPGGKSKNALLDCLGFAPIYCDVHGESDGWEELKLLLELLPAKTSAFGIRAGHALRVCDGIVEAIG